MTMPGELSAARVSCDADTAAAVSASTCPYRELHPAVLMMNPAEKRPHGELTEPFDRAVGRRILAHGQMRSKRVVIARVARKDSAQVGFAKNDDVIQAFPADRADQSLCMPVLPR